MVFVLDTIYTRPVVALRGQSASGGTLEERLGPLRGGLGFTTLKVWQSLKLGNPGQRQRKDALGFGVRVGVNPGVLSPLLLCRLFSR